LHDSIASSVRSIASIPAMNAAGTHGTHHQLSHIHAHHAPARHPHSAHQFHTARKHATCASPVSLLNRWSWIMLSVIGCQLSVISYRLSVRFEQIADFP
jgi:hypothetical protein